MKAKKWLSIASLGVVLALAATSTGCFGKFALTRKVYNWNDSLGNGVVKTLVFWGLTIIPVYAVAGTADILVLNVIEFWAGSNPIGGAEPGEHRVLADGSVEIRQGADVWLFVPTDDSHFQVLRDGIEVATAQIRGPNDLALIRSDANGRVSLLRRQGEMVSMR